MIGPRPSIKAKELQKSGPEQLISSEERRASFSLAALLPRIVMKSTACSPAALRVHRRALLPG